MSRVAPTPIRPQPAPPSAHAGSFPLKASKVVPWLSLLVAVLAVIATATGLWWGGGQEAPATVVSVRGETVELYGQGLYRYDSVFKGAANRGTDAVMLVAGVPFLLVTALLYRRGSVRGALLLTGALGWCLYLYATLAVGTAYNELFLVHVALFGASLYAFGLALGSIDIEALSHRLGPGLPRRTLAAFLMLSGVFTLVIWVGPILTAMGQANPPELLGAATTPVTEALDLAIIVPATIIAGALLLRGRTALGAVIAVPLLTLLVALTPVIIAQTIAQLAAGITFTTAEIVGPISGFLVLGGTAAVLLVKVLHAVPPALRRPEP